MTVRALALRPSGKDAIVGAPFGLGANVLAAVNQYPAAGYREYSGALIEETSAFRLDVEQFHDMHVLVRSRADDRTLDVRNDAVRSTVGYESSCVPEIHLENEFQFPGGERAVLDQNVLVSVTNPALLVRNRVRFERERRHDLYTTVGLGMEDRRTGVELEEAYYLEDRGSDFVVATDGDRHLALTHHRPATGQTTFDGHRVGQYGVTSGPRRSAWADIYLDDDGDIERRNVAGRPADAGVRIQGGRDTEIRWTTGVGFGRSESEAIGAVRRALDDGYRKERSRFRSAWQRWHDGLDAAGSDVTPGETYRLSATSIKAAQDPSGGIVAGAFKPAAYSYRLVWPRDLVVMIQALAAVGATDDARAGLEWLDDAQVTANRHDRRGIDRRGTWWQNYFVDGTGYWPALQLDQVAGPIYAHWLLWQDTGDDSLLSAHYPMSERAAEFLLGFDSGGFPRRHQDPWEEIWGYTTGGSAAAIAGLRSMAALADAAGDGAFAAQCRERADEWATNFEARCFVEDGLLGAHFVSATDPEEPDDPPADVRPDAAAFMAYWPWNVVDADADAMLATLGHADSPPWRASGTRCLGRYPEDDYTPTGNAEDGGWPVCEAYADVVRWRSGRDADAVAEFLRTDAPEWTTAAGLLPERVDAVGQPRWNANLLWSQAMVVLLAESHRRGEPFGMAPEG